MDLNLNLRLGRSHETTPSSSGYPARRCSPPGTPSLRPCIQNTLLASRCRRRSVQIEPWTRGGNPARTGIGHQSRSECLRPAVGIKNFPHLKMETSLKPSPRGILTEERPSTLEARQGRTGYKIFQVQINYSMGTHKVVTFVRRATIAYHQKSDRLTIQVVSGPFPKRLDITSTRVPGLACEHPE